MKNFEQNSPGGLYTILHLFDIVEHAVLRLFSPPLKNDDVVVVYFFEGQECGRTEPTSVFVHIWTRPCVNKRLRLSRDGPLHETYKKIRKTEKKKKERKKERNEYKKIFGFGKKNETDRTCGGKHFEIGHVLLRCTKRQWLLNFIGKRNGRRYSSGLAAATPLENLWNGRLLNDADDTYANRSLSHFRS